MGHSLMGENNDINIDDAENARDLFLKPIEKTPREW